MAGSAPASIGAAITIKGGNGGAGGAGASGGNRGANGGSGGNGGYGIDFTNAGGATVTVNGSVIGGNGGAGGLGGTGTTNGVAGASGAGGDGVIGQNLTITLGASGSITGGLSGDGATRANAITFNSGANTLTLQGGTLNGNIAINGNGGLTFNQTSDQTLNNVITGNGTVIQNGSGTLTLVGANIYSGDTAISAGTLQIGNGGTSGSIVGNVTDSGTFAINRSDNYTFGGAISGTGAFQQLGSGTTILTGTNTYNGDTTVSAGTLQAGAANTFSSSSAFSVSSGATLDLNGISQTIGSLAGNGNVTLGSATLTTGGTAASTTFSGTISGTGQVIKTGEGTFVLSGTNSYSGGTQINSAHTSDSSGVLQVTNNSSVGTGTVTLNGGAFQAGADGLSFSNDFVLDPNEFNRVDTQDNTLTLSGSISGTGMLRKIGTGTLVLTSFSNTYSGDTLIRAGTLDVEGSLGNTAVSVQNGSTLTGTGSITGSVTVESGGALAPGSTGPGTITTGPLTLNTGSQLIYDLGTPNVSDHRIGRAADDRHGHAGAFRLQHI